MNDEKRNVLKIRDRYTFTKDNIEVHRKLPVANYILNFDIDDGYFLQTIPKFELPERLYGNPKKVSDRYLNTFNKHDKNLGVLLKGTKGSGKSLLAKMMCNESNLPVIIINMGYSGTDFLEFLGAINQKVIVFIDEFEKIYTEERINGKGASQEDLLSLFDGVFSSKTLFLLTANENTISSYLVNRPGRIHYVKNYFGLDTNAINEIVDDILINKDHKKDLMAFINISPEINMDSLISIIREMNDYNEPIKDVLQHLNITLENDLYDISFKREIKQIKRNEDGSPVMENGKITYTRPVLSEYKAKYVSINLLEDDHFSEYFYYTTEEGKSQGAFIEFDIPRDLNIEFNQKGEFTFFSEGENGRTKLTLTKSKIPKRQFTL